MKLVLFTCSSFGVLTLLLKNIYEVVSKIKQSFVQKSLDIEWYTYVDLAVVGLCITSIVYWFKLFITTK